MELSTINTPQDLVELNNEPTPPSVSRLDSLIEDMDLMETYELSLRLIQNLGKFHQHMIEKLTEEGDCDRLVLWVQDEQKLHTCHDILHEVYDSE